MTTLIIRPLREADLEEADRICRVAFGTFLGAPEPERFMGDAGYVSTRFRADPSAAFAAESDGQVVGSNFATRWGSFGFFGPLTVRPDLWDRGVARRLLDRTMERFAEWGTEHHGLFTFSHSPKHVALYRRYGFWPRFLTAICEKRLPNGELAKTPETRTVSELGLDAGLHICREISSDVFPGLDLERELRAVHDQNLGETLISRDAGFAVCHFGPGSEAGSGRGYVKFAAVRPGAGACREFEHLLAACEALASASGVSTLVAGVNLARERATRLLGDRGYRAEILGVAMQQPNEAGFNHPESFVLDDWR